MTGDQFVYLTAGMLIGVIFMITANILRGNPRADELQREIQSFCLVELDQIDRISDLEKEVGTLRRVNAQQAITMREQKSSIDFQNSNILAKNACMLDLLAVSDRMREFFYPKKDGNESHQPAVYEEVTNRTS